MQISMNDMVKIRLSEAGRETLNSYYASIGEGFDAPKADENGFCKLPLNKVMRVFGPHMLVGFTNQFHDNAIHTT